MITVAVFYRVCPPSQEPRVQSTTEAQDKPSRCRFGVASACSGVTFLPLGTLVPVPSKVFLLRLSASCLVFFLSFSVFLQCLCFCEFLTFFLDFVSLISVSAFSLSSFYSDFSFIAILLQNICLPSSVLILRPLCS